MHRKLILIHLSGLNGLTPAGHAKDGRADGLWAAAVALVDEAID